MKKIIIAILLCVGILVGLASPSSAGNRFGDRFKYSYCTRDQMQCWYNTSDGWFTCYKGVCFKIAYGPRRYPGATIICYDVYCGPRP